MHTIPASIDLWSLQQIYYTIVSIGIFFAWDFFLSVGKDILILTTHGIKLYDVGYILSRLATGGAVAGSLTFISNHDNNCEHLLLATGCLMSLIIISNSSLFYLRALAVFTGSKAGIVFITLLWLTTFTAISIPLGIGAGLETSQRRCIVTTVLPYTSIGIVASLIFDTGVFLAISYQVLQTNFIDMHTNKLASRACGGGMGAVSRALLQSGEIYYCTVIWPFSLATICVLSPASWFSPYFKFCYTLLSLVTQNVLLSNSIRWLKIRGSQDGPSMFHSTQQLQSLLFARFSLEDDINGHGAQAVSLERIV